MILARDGVSMQMSRGLFQLDQESGGVCNWGDCSQYVRHLCFDCRLSWCLERATT